MRNPSLRPSAIIGWATRTTFQVSARVEGKNWQLGVLRVSLSGRLIDCAATRQLVRSRTLEQHTEVEAFGTLQMSDERLVETQNG